MSAVKLFFDIVTKIVQAFVTSVNQGIKSRVEELRALLAQPLLNMRFHFLVCLEAPTSKVFLHAGEKVKIRRCKIRAVWRVG